LQVCQFDRGRFDGPQDRSSDGSFSEHFGEFRSGNGSRNEIALAAVTTEFEQLLDDRVGLDALAMTPRFSARQSDDRLHNGPVVASVVIPRTKLISSFRRSTGRFFRPVIDAKPVPKSSRAISTPSAWKLFRILAIRSGSSRTAYS